MNQLKSELLFQASRARSLLFAVQYLGYNKLISSLPGTKGVLRSEDPLVFNKLKEEGERLLRSDAQLFSRGILSFQNHLGPSPIPSLADLWDGISDGWKVYRRRSANRFEEFSSSEADKYPKYYQRNFHFQTDGYLSEESARRYDRQVELLFSGTAGAMRRSWVESYLKVFAQNQQRNRKNTHKIDLHRPKKVLEIACGSGSGTGILVDLFPESRLLIQDISGPYLKIAEKRVAPLCANSGQRLEVLEGTAEALPIEDSSIDFCQCIYLFHELPLAVRRKVLREVHRVLSPGGRFVVVDSLQLGDIPQFDSLLKNFPVNFHEPFYLSYIRTQMDKLSKEAGFKVTSQGNAFMSKFLILEKHK